MKFSFIKNKLNFFEENFYLYLYRYWYSVKLKFTLFRTIMPIIVFFYRSIRHMIFTRFLNIIYYLIIIKYRTLTAIGNAIVNNIVSINIPTKPISSNVLRPAASTKMDDARVIATFIAPIAMVPI